MKKLCWPQNPPVILPFGEIRGSEKERIYIQLRDLIVFSEFPPSQQLKERELAERFGVSRTPLREVLQLLSYQGLVVIRPRQGVMVAPINEEQVRHIFEVRSPLEREVARLAALRATPDEAAGLLEMAELSEEAFAYGGVEDVIRADAAFHAVLARMAKNPVLFRSREALHNICLRYWFLIRNEYKARPDEKTSHREVALAIQARDAALSARLLDLHVMAFARLLA